METLAKKIPVRPIRDRIVCEQMTGVDEEVSQGGIILPKGGDGEGNIRARVMAVGSGAVSEYGQRIPMDVQVGEVVVFQQGLEEEIVIDGKTYLVILEAEVIAVVDDE